MKSMFHYRPNGLIPFRMGKRVFLGKKLALADIFLIIVNLLQRTSGDEFVLPDGPGTVNLTPDPNKGGNWMPLNYEILLKSTL